MRWRHRHARTRTVSNETQKNFIRVFSSALRPKLRDLDNFIDAVNKPTEGACNLLCQQRLAPRFWVHEAAGAIDLIRYVFTSTCFGVQREPGHRAEAFARLDKALSDLGSDTGSYIRALLVGVSDQERHFLRGELGDLQSTVDSGFPNNSPKFKTSKVLWTRSAIFRYPAPHRKPPQQSETKRTAEREACASNFVVRVPQP
jgi:hypothetical protein